MMHYEELHPFPNCPVLDGCHCQTNSLAKMFRYYNHPLSEDMLLGIGSGMGYRLWFHRGIRPFTDGRINLDNFFTDIAKRTGITIRVKCTPNRKKAESILLNKLLKQKPVMISGDLGLLPWFAMQEDYHFGLHTFVICGYNGINTVLASDIEQKAGKLKKGFYHPISLKQLAEARDSHHQPFLPRNRYFEFDFSNFHYPRKEDIYDSIKQTIDQLLNPPIRTIGVQGLRYTARQLLRWPEMFSDKLLRTYLFHFYTFIEVGGTGGGCFRYMYARFLKEAELITGDAALGEASAQMNEAGKLFTEAGLLFKDAYKVKDLPDRIERAALLFNRIAELEQSTFHKIAVIDKHLLYNDI